MDPITIGIVLTFIIGGICVYVFKLATRETSFEEVDI